MKKKYYLAYGSNLNIEQMKLRCPTAEVVGTTELEGCELQFRGSRNCSYLTIGQCPTGTVPVAVWAVTEADERSLDRYEGYPGLYYKKNMRISVRGSKNGKMVCLDAFVYLMHEQYGFGLPTAFYMSVCTQGYGDFGFDTEKLMTAYTKSLEELRNEKR